MTEKRFTNVEVDDYYNLICVNDGDTFHSYSEKALEDLLNELSDENRQLKSELNECNRIKTKRTEKMKNQRKALNDMQEALWGKTKGEHKQEYYQTKRRIKEIYDFFGWEYD